MTDDLKHTSQPLTGCPVCNYDFTGLPPAHRCPECDFEYDASMRGWEFSALSAWTCAGLALMAAIFAFPAVDQLFLGLKKPIAVAPVFRVSLIIYVGLLLAVSVYAFRRTRGKTRIVMADRGLLWIGPGKHIREFDWSEIWMRDSRGTRKPPWVEQYNRGLVQVHPIRSFFFRERGICNDASVIYLRPKDPKRARKFDEYLPVRALAGKFKKSVMSEICERWCVATGSR